jgi:metal-responsive CopG/Arc/MetJ family transcriptional regulator
MEIITFKLQGDILREIDDILRPLHFSNRTEFIREAVREKLNKIEKDLFLDELEKFKGAARTRVSDKRLHKIREEVAKKYAERLGIRSD